MSIELIPVRAVATALARSSGARLEMQMHVKNITWESMSFDDRQRFVVGWLLTVARVNDPRTFQGFFGGIVGNVVGNLPRDYFDQFVVASPCSEPDCDCHIIAKPFLDSLKAIRADHRQVVDGKAGRIAQTE